MRPQMNASVGAVPPCPPVMGVYQHNRSVWNGIYTHEASENAIDISQDSELFNR